MKKSEIDPGQVEQLAARFWKNTEIASFFGCSEGTIRKGFPKELQKGRELGKGKLRDAQLAAAFKGSAALLIWLGKQYLDQTEKVEVTNNELMKEELEVLTPTQKYEARNRIKNLINKN